MRSAPQLSPLAVASGTATKGGLCELEIGVAQLSLGQWLRCYICTLPLLGEGN